MKTLFVMLMLASGFSVSYYLIKSSKQKSLAAVSLYRLSSTLEERIRYARAPIDDILSAAQVEELLRNSADPEVTKLTELICSSDYEAALSYAALLKKHTEKEMQTVVEREEKSRGAMAFLPPAAAALVAILLI